MLPVVADHVVDPDARDLVGLAEAKQRAGHALRAAELVDVAALRHDLGLRAGILRDPHVAAVALVLIGDRLRAVVGGNGAEGKAQSGGDAGKPCGEVHFDFSLCGPSGLSVSAHRRGRAEASRRPAAGRSLSISRRHYTSPNSVERFNSLRSTLPNTSFAPTSGKALRTSVSSSFTAWRRRASG